MMSHDESRSCCPWLSKINGRARIGLLIVLLIAAATRVIGLSSLDIWGDEVYSHVASSDLLPKLLKWETAGNESSSPWPFIEMKVARQVFGEESPLSLRLPSALHGILAVALLYLMLTLIVDWRIAFWASLLLAINPHGLEWSREGRMYTQWLSATVLLLAVVHQAVEDVRLRGGPWHSWRWWLTGCLFTAVHAMNVMGVMTIAGIALWLGIIALAELRTSRPVALRIILGSALAGFTYLISWGLTGIAKILMLMGVSKAAGNYVPASAISQIREFITALPGHMPLPVALLLWAAAAAGFILLARQGRWRLALLVAIGSMAPWLGFTSITKTHFWAPRYAFTAILFLSVGLGALLAGLWHGQLLRQRNAGRAIAAALLIASIAFAAPYLREIFFVPKMAVKQAFGVIKEHGREGEVVMLFPDYYIVFNDYKPTSYDQKAKVIRGPKSTWLDAGDTFVDTFDHLYGDGRPEDAKPPVTLSVKLPKPPPAAWLFMLRPEWIEDPAKPWAARLKEVEPVLAAYGLTADALQEAVKSDPFTLTIRISRDKDGQGVIDHVTPTVGRRFR